MIPSRPVALQEWHATKLRGPHDQRVIEQTAPLEIAQQRRSRLIHDLCLHGVRVLNVRVGIPVGDAVAAGRVAAVEKLHDAHALLDKAPRKDAILGVLLPQITATPGAVFLLDKLRFAADIHHLRHGCLHLAGQLVTGNARCQVSVAGKFLEVLVV